MSYTARGVHAVEQRSRSRRIPAGLFKARCLALMDRVQRTGEELLITKRDQPVAMLVPVRTRASRAFVGRMRNTMKVTGDIVAATAQDWEVDADL